VTLDTIYGIEVGGFTDEIQPWEPDYDHDDYGSRISSNRSSNASSYGQSPSESDLIHDMFSGLKK